MSTKTCPKGGLSIVPDGILSNGPGLPARTVSNPACLHPRSTRNPWPVYDTNSPKPNIPPPSAYDPPPPPSPRDLGPPPPGYGRYADFDHGTGSGMQPGGGQPPRRNLDEVMCFKVRTPLVPFAFALIDGLNHIKCGEKGHYANHCTNRNKPGNRGGIDRATRRFDE